MENILSSRPPNITKMNTLKVGREHQEKLDNAVCKAMDGSMDKNYMVRDDLFTDENTTDKKEINADKTDQYLSATDIVTPDKSDRIRADKNNYITPANGNPGEDNLDVHDDGIPRIVDGLETPDSEAHPSIHELFMDFMETDASEDLMEAVQEEDILHQRSLPSPDQDKETSTAGSAAVHQSETDNKNDFPRTLITDPSSREIEDCNLIDSSEEHILWNLETQDAVQFEEEVCVDKSTDTCNDADNCHDAANDYEADSFANLNSTRTIDERTNEQSTKNAESIHTDNNFVVKSKKDTLNSNINDRDIVDNENAVNNDVEAGTSKEAINDFSLKKKRKNSPVIPPHIPEIKEDFDNTCTLCDKTFPRKDKVMRHMAIHIPEIPEYCQLCNKPLVKEDVYLLQIITTDVMFSCKKCEEFFCGSYPPLGGKMEFVHMFHEKDIVIYMKKKKKVTPPRSESSTHRFSCDICEESFILEQSLEFHVIKMHTNNQDDASKSKPVPQKSIKQNAKKSRKLNPFIESLKAGPRNGRSNRIFTCNLCHHPYRMKSSLTRHMKTCTGGQEFPCDLCDIIFGTISELRVHKRKDHRASKIDE